MIYYQQSRTTTGLFSTLSQFDLLQSLTVNEVRKNRDKGLHRGGVKNLLRLGSTYV